MFLQLDAILKPILESPLSFPALECIHIFGFALGVGTIAMVDYRMLGWGFRGQKISELAAGLSGWTTLGITLVLLSGAAMFASDPDFYYLNPSFQLKMVLLLAALILHYTVRMPRALDDDRAKWPAVVSLGLWAAMVFCGIFIAFTGEAA